MLGPNINIIVLRKPGTVRATNSDCLGQTKHFLLYVIIRKRQTVIKGPIIRREALENIVKLERSEKAEAGQEK